MTNKHVNLKIIDKKHQKNKYKIKKYGSSFSTFTEKLIIFYIIIHELSGIKQREYIIENLLHPHLKT